jgi:hypothetical protein
VCDSPAASAPLHCWEHTHSPATVQAAPACAMETAISQTSLPSHSEEYAG